MIIRYATKRDINGNRYYLIIDTEAKTYALTPSKWFNKEDYITATKTDKRKAQANIEELGFTEVYSL